MSELEQQIDMKELASKLSNPNGTLGLEIADRMHDTNMTMTMEAANMLRVKDNDSGLEIGHGSGKHLPYLLSLANGIWYTGFEVSELMHTEALKADCSKEHGAVASYRLYNGNEFPFKDECFDKILSVNTIYFWKDVEFTISEIARVLKKRWQLLLGVCPQGLYVQITVHTVRISDV